MIVIVGLGNPGEKFKKSWHNLGFETIDKLAKENHFPEFKKINKLKSSISKGEIGKNKVILCKPQTFMNNSGEGVEKILKNWKVQKENLIVVHDDIDIILGKIKISKNHGAAGHKGVDSIIKKIGTKNFIRIRIGIQPKTGKPNQIENFVLQKFQGEEVKESIKKALRAAETIVEAGVEKAMQKYNK